MSWVRVSPSGTTTTTEGATFHQPLSARRPPVSRKRNGPVDDVAWALKNAAFRLLVATEPFHRTAWRMASALASIGTVAVPDQSPVFDRPVGCRLTCCQTPGALESE